MVGLLREDVLAAGSEDDVYNAVLAYIEACDAGSGGPVQGVSQISEKDRQALWGCCRFAYCSAGVQTKLARLPEAAGGLLGEYLLGMMAKQRLGDAAGDVMENVVWPGECSQMRPRRKVHIHLLLSTLPLSLPPFLDPLLPSSLCTPIPFHPSFHLPIPRLSLNMERENFKL